MVIEELREQLKQGEVKFSYTKKDGSIREARGTLNFDLIPQANIPVTDASYNPSVQRYYDLDVQGWRSFVIENLLE